MHPPSTRWTTLAPHRFEVLRAQQISERSDNVGTMRQTHLQRTWIDMKRGYTFPGQQANRLGNQRLHTQVINSQREAIAQYNQTDRFEAPARPSAEQLGAPKAQVSK